MDASPPGLGEILQQFRLDLPWIIILAAAVSAWFLGLRRAKSNGQPHPWPRTVAFCFGLLLLVVATLSPLEHYGNQLLWANFLGFLVLTMIAAPLLIASGPLTLAFRASDKAGRQHLRRIYRGFPAAPLTFPIVTWLAFAVTTYLWQFSSLAEFATRHWWLRDIQLLTLLFVALLFWYPALASDPVRWRMAHPLRALYVFVEMTHKGLFGGMFLSMATPFHEHFAKVPPAWAPDPMTDQRVAILILWIGGNAFFMIALASIILGWTRYESRNQRRTDLRLARKREAERRRRAALDQVFTR